MIENKRNSVSFLFMSGLDFPARSRAYLPQLIKEIAEKEKVGFIVIGGHVLAGKELESLLKHRLKEELKGVAPKEREDRRTEVTDEFIQETAQALDEFLPRVGNINYHIVVAQRVYDRPIGMKVLEELVRMRKDVRISDDPETKFTIQLPGFGDMRTIVPRKTPWFYENVTGLMQRLINGFSSRTFSPRPSLILVGCTGVGAFIPRYKGVPAISAPTCHKIDEQLSTENMVGGVVVKITKLNGGKFRILPKFYDFRTIIFSEKDLVIPKHLTRRHRRVIEALKPGGASITTIRFRINHPQGGEVRNWSKEKTDKYVKQLVKWRVLSYNKKVNRFAVSENLSNQGRVTLDEFLKDSREIAQVAKSCWHVGSLKTLYYTVLRDEPELAVDADVIVSNGDVIQGISHNYEYNGELLPILNGPDKHESLAAKMQAWIIMRIFAHRFGKLRMKRCRSKDILERCLITFAYKHGNHDEPRFSGSKNSVPLMIFDAELRSLLISQIIHFLESKHCKEVDTELVERMVNEKILRIGENRVVKVNGIPIGVKHPFQSRTKSKGIRIQETSNFFQESMKDWPDRVTRALAIVDVANFHEAAAIFHSNWGKTTFGVMTGAQIYDSSFESNQNKVVDHGLAKSRVCLNASGQILWASVEYSTDIAKEDEKIVYAENLTNENVSGLCTRLSKQFDGLWR